MLGRQRGGDLPGADRGPCHALLQGLAGDDEDVQTRHEVLGDPERLDECVVTGHVAVDRVRRFDRVPEEREQLAVGPPPLRLELAPRGHERREVLDEVVDRVRPGQRHLGQRDIGFGLPAWRAL